MKKSFILLYFLPFLAFAQNKHNLEIVVKGLSNNKGKVYVGVYNSEETFLRKVFLGNISKINQKEAVVKFKDVPEGIYAVTAFHDENNNDKLDTNMFGIPKEDYMVSNNAKNKFSAPKYKDAKFKLKKDTIITFFAK